MEEFGTLFQGIGLLVTGAGFITSISVAGSWIWKGIKNLRRPHTELVSKVNEVKGDLNNHIEDNNKQNGHYDRCLSEDQKSIREVKTDIQILFSMLLRLAHKSNSEDEFYRIRCEIEDHLVHKSLDYNERK